MSSLPSRLFCVASLLAASLVTGCDDDPSGTSAGAPSGSSSSGMGGAGGASGTGGSGGDTEVSFKTVSGFSDPESAHWDAINKVWYVSNMAYTDPDVTKKDGQGWISRLDEKGEIKEEKWVEGLDTPAGMRILDGILYVANITEVVAIDTSTGMITSKIEVPGALLLNDVDADGGAIFISDTFNNAIYTFKPNDKFASELIKTPDLKGPNGILVDGSKLIIASLIDFESPAGGPLLFLDIGTKALEGIGTLTGKLDGIERDGDTFLVSDNQAATLYRVAADGTYEVAFDLKKDHGLQTAADIGIDPARRIIAIPDIAGNTVSFLEVK